MSEYSVVLSFTTQLFQFGTPYFRIFIAWLVLGSAIVPGADKTIHCGVLFLQGPGQKDMISPVASFFMYFSEMKTS